jgi:hypothetical protein
MLQPTPGGAGMVWWRGGVVPRCPKGGAPEGTYAAGTRKDFA